MGRDVWIVDGPMEISVAPEPGYLRNTKTAVNDISVYFLEGTGSEEGLGPCPSLEAWHAEVDPSVLPGAVGWWPVFPGNNRRGICSQCCASGADEDVVECVLMSVCFYIDTSMVYRVAAHPLFTGTCVCASTFE